MNKFMRHSSLQSVLNDMRHSSIQSVLNDTRLLPAFADLHVHSSQSINKTHNRRMDVKTQQTAAANIPSAPLRQQQLRLARILSKFHGCLCVLLPALLLATTLAAALTLDGLAFNQASFVAMFRLSCFVIIVLFDAAVLTAQLALHKNRLAESRWAAAWTCLPANDAAKVCVEHKLWGIVGLVNCCLLSIASGWVHPAPHVCALWLALVSGGQHLASISTDRDAMVAFLHAVTAASALPLLLLAATVRQTLGLVCLAKCVGFVAGAVCLLFGRNISRLACLKLLSLLLFCGFVWLQISLLSERMEKSAYLLRMAPAIVVQVKCVYCTPSDLGFFLMHGLLHADCGDH